MYPLPTFTVDRGSGPEQMVPFANADELRRMARGSLSLIDQEQ
jgi:hypothetical protein